MSAEEGENFAKTHGCLFVETSAKADVAVTQAFEELVLKVHSSCYMMQHAACSLTEGVLNVFLDLPTSSTASRAINIVLTGAGDAEPALRCGQLAAARGCRHPADTVGLLRMTVWPPLRAGPLQLRRWVVAQQQSERT